jgi:phage tail sheath protein FI
MSVSPTYPGVYIQEIPSGVRTITGVATSITALIGRALRGPVNQPVTINGYADFENAFGGLWAQSTLGYAVRDFFLNGGSQAIIVRLFNDGLHHPPGGVRSRSVLVVRALDHWDRQSTRGVADAANTAADKGQSAGDVAKAARDQANTYQSAGGWSWDAANAVASAAEAEAAKTDASGQQVADAASAEADTQLTAIQARLALTQLTLEAANDGSWGNNLRARIDTNIPNVPGFDPSTQFNLTVQDTSTGQVEVFRNVSLVPGDPRQVDQVLEQQSQLVRVHGTLPSPQNPSEPLVVGLVPSGQNPFSYVFSSGVADDGQAGDGQELVAADYLGDMAQHTGIYALDSADLFNLLCLTPPLTTDIESSVWADAAVYCESRRAMLLVDPPSGWTSKDDAIAGLAAGVGTTSKNAAIFFPRLCEPDPMLNNRIGVFVPSGAVAGIFARTDAQRGVWKAPAGLDATFVGVPQLSVPLTDAENGELNPLGLNCLRARPAVGPVVWGARTMQGDDRLASEWKYTPVRRLALYLEESLFRGTQWAVFEPNDAPLWAEIRLNVGAFMQNLFRQGAFQGQTPRDAYLVKCDSETTTQNDINLGIVNVLVGFAPLKPAEFVIIRIQQLAGQVGT